MTDITADTVTVNGVTYIRADMAPKPNAESPWRICVLHRGNVMVGRYTEDGDHRFLDDAKVIRRWGTTKGLGELVNGPLADTVLDPTNGQVRYHYAAELFTIAVDADAWGRV